MTEGENVAIYLNNFTTIMDKLAEVDIELNQELVAIILLSSLPKEFENFVIAMETRDSLPSVDILKLKLLEEGERRGDMYEYNQREVNGQQAFAAKSAQSSSRKREKGNKKMLFAFNVASEGISKSTVRRRKSIQQNNNKTVFVHSIGCY